MGYVFSKTGSGLVRADHGSDAATIGRLLQSHDPDLRLVPQFSEQWKSQYWAVYRFVGSERPAELICAWVDDQVGPLPLSSAILDRVQMLDRNSPGKAPDADEINRRKRERDKAQAAKDFQDLADDWRSTEGVSALLPRSQSLRQARSRTGYHNRKGR